MKDRAMTPHELADSLRELCKEIEAEQEAYLLELRKVADMIEALDKPAVMPPDLPDLVYRSQWDVDAKFVKSDCGPTSLAMLLDYRGIHIAIDDISRTCGLGPAKKYTTAGDLVNAARAYGLELAPVSGWTLEQFAARTPCIVLVHYSVFKDRQDVNYTNGHWVVLLGVRDHTAIFHDPDWWTPRRNEGASRKVDTIIFAMGMHDCIQDGNSSGTGLVMVH
jgi:hypothetical protein